MIRYSHVSLMILCKVKSDADLITAHFGVQPTTVREDKLNSWSKEAGHSQTISYTWVFDSPKCAQDANPTGRLLALADAIEPFGERIVSLDANFKRSIDIIYHITPQYPHGITGEFDWFCMPAVLMRRFAAWNLDVSYEAFWFDHPDWVNPSRRSWWQRFLSGFRSRRQNASPALTSLEK